MANQKTSDYTALPAGVMQDTDLLDVARPGSINYKATKLEAAQNMADSVITGLNTTEDTVKNSINGVFTKGASAGVLTGGTITDAGGGNIDIAAGVGLFRTTDAHLGVLVELPWPQLLAQAIPADTIRYVGVQYNSGTPQVVIKTTDTWDIHTEFSTGCVVNEAGTLYFIDNPWLVANASGHAIERFYETQPFQRANRLGGLIVGETGTRNITLTAGEIYDRTNEFIINALDTSVAGGFDSYLGLTLNSAANTQWDNLNYDNAGVLTALGVNKWGVLWWYIEADDDLVMVYGTQEHNTSAAASLEDPPAVIPLRLQAHSSQNPAARTIFQQNAATGIFQTTFTNVFSGTVASDHTQLSNLTTGDAGHTQFPLLNGRPGDVQKIDEINEYTPDNGTKIENVILKDGSVNVRAKPAALLFGDVSGDPIGWWHFNSSVGINVFDASPSGINGVTVNMNDTNWVAGKLNNCLQYNGADEYVNYGNNFNFDLSNTFTFEAWINADIVSGGVIFSKINASNVGYYVNMRPTGELQFVLRDGATYLIARTTPTFSVATWYSLMVTYNGSGTYAGMKIYVNGILQTTSDQSLGLPTTISNTDPFLIGARIAVTPSYWDGKIDESVVWNVVKDAAYALQRYNGGAGTETIVGIDYPGRVDVDNVTGKMTHQYSGDTEMVTTGDGAEILMTPPANGAFKVTDGKFGVKSGTTVNNISIDGTLTGATDDEVSTSKALKEYIDTHAEHWQKAVINFVDFTTAEPGSPSVGDRYINTVTGSSSGTTQSVTADYIYEWNGADWTETVPKEGYRVWVNDLDKAYLYTGTAWVNEIIPVLAQKQIYYYGDAGNDSNSGTSEDTPFLTLAAANAAALAQTPSAVNQFEIRSIGAIITNEDFTAHSFITYNLRNATLIGHVTISGTPTINVENWFGDTAAAFTISKDASAGDSVINISNELNFPSSVKGVKNVSLTGELIINVPRVEYSDLNAFGEDTTGVLIVNAQQITGLGNCVYSNAAGIIHINCPYIAIATGAIYKITAGGGFVFSRASRLTAGGSGGQIYDVAAGGLYYTSLSEQADTASSRTGGTVSRRTMKDTDNQTYLEANNNVIIQTNNAGSTVWLRGNASNANAGMMANQFGRLFLTGNQKLAETALVAARQTVQALAITGDGTLHTMLYNAEDVDLGGDYNPVTGVFTARVDGVHNFQATIWLRDLTTLHTSGFAYFEINGVTDYRFYQGNPANEMDATAGVNNGDLAINGMLPIKLDATDTVKVIVVISGGTKVVNLKGNIIQSTFSAQLMTAV